MVARAHTAQRSRYSAARPQRAASDFPATNGGVEHKAIYRLMPRSNAIAHKRTRHGPHQQSEPDAGCSGQFGPRPLGASHGAPPRGSRQSWMTHGVHRVWPPPPPSALASCSDRQSAHWTSLAERVAAAAPRPARGKRGDFRESKSSFLRPVQRASLQHGRRADSSATRGAKSKATRYTPFYLKVHPSPTSPYSHTSRSYLYRNRRKVVNARPYP